MGDTINFQEVLKKSVLELEAFKQVSITEIIIGLLISYLLGMFIYWTYYKTFRGVVYSHNYNLTFVIMTMLTTIVIMTISTNIVLSLGMVGALSIVRFRTAVKDPLDIMFMFWAITVGIATGAKIYPIAIIGSIAVSAVLFMLAKSKRKDSPYLLIVNFEERASDQVKTALRKMNHVLKSKTVRKDMTEMTVEIRLRDDNTAFVSEISNFDGVKDAVLISYNGDYAP
ncbi:DUF4956 domain-containing protein [Paenibacillus sp. CF384]|uniref:DUF4956 domain-containing protein n=1 Tax=Paenibacillus sp. CF384 TaxID=1884382 RepID=UPI0008955790|nr:DUF4956 domain-containing protein [Paenibacillus sp. CF384]SDW66485.1 Uncharacterized membrane protein YhiD, involved in acid resistance [Paenibacillus sp. CF384]